MRECILCILGEEIKKSYHCNRIYVNFFTHFHINLHKFFYGEGLLKVIRMSKKHSIEISDSLEELLEVKSNQIEKRKKKLGPSQIFSSENDLSPEDLDQLSTIIKKSPKNLINYISTPQKVEQIRITAKAFDEIIMLSIAVNEISKDRWGPDAAKLEVYCYVLGDKLDELQSEPSPITSIYIPFHSASESNVNVSEEAIIEVKEYIEKENKVVLGWAHSHGHYAVYSSETDEVNHLTLLYDTANYFQENHFQLKYIYGITVNDNADRFGVILTHFPCNHLQRAEDTQFEIIGDPYPKEEYIGRYKEIKAIVTDRVKIRPPGPKLTRQDQISNINDELLAHFVSKMRRAKNLLIDQIPEELDQHFESIQQIILQYDELIIDSIEESFMQSSKELLKTLKNLKDSR